MLYINVQTTPHSELKSYSKWITHSRKISCLAYWQWNLHIKICMFSILIYKEHCIQSQSHSKWITRSRKISCLKLSLMKKGLLPSKWSLFLPSILNINIFEYERLINYLWLVFTMLKSFGTYPAIITGTVSRSCNRYCGYDARCNFTNK